MNTNFAMADGRRVFVANLRTGFSGNARDKVLAQASCSLYVK